MGVTIERAIESIIGIVGERYSEIVPLESALGRVSGETVGAQIALPTFNNSAMDGYGLRGEFLDYEVVGKVLAGDAHTVALQEGEALRITTGARVPESVERIIPQENVRRDGERIVIEKPVKIGANIRYMGEDIRHGEKVIERGEKITAAHIGLLASQGITHLKVYRRPRVSIFAGGSELKLHFETIEEAQVYNSNTPYLIARSQELGAKTTFVGRAEDSVASLKSLITSALDADLIVTSGGVSVGEADFTKEAFGELGFEPLFTKVAIKPGKPTTFGRIGRTLVLNLPGNPLASALNFEIFGKLLIRKLGGYKEAYQNVMMVPMAENFIQKKAVDSVIPGFYDGNTFAPAEKYAPGMVNVLPHCNGIIIVSSETKVIQKGQSVKFIPIRWDFGSETFVDLKS